MFRFLCSVAIEQAGEWVENDDPVRRALGLAVADELFRALVREHLSDLARESGWDHAKLLRLSKRYLPSLAV